MSGIDFKQKISVQRPFGKPSSAEDEYDITRVFESDRGRIVNSAAIRRLQQKHKSSRWSVMPLSVAV